MIECQAMGSKLSCTLCHSFKKAGFDLLSPDCNTGIEAQKQSRHFRKNDIIFSQGEVISDIHCINTGLIKLESVGEDGHTVTVGLLKAGDLLGLGNILSHTPTSYSATAIEDTFA